MKSSRRREEADRQVHTPTCPSPHVDGYLQRDVDGYLRGHVDGCVRGHVDGCVRGGRALETFYRFLEAASFPGQAKPGVFLTDNGCIELCWEEESGKAVQVEFRSGEVEFFIEARNTEGVIPNAAVADLALRPARG